MLSHTVFWLGVLLVSITQSKYYDSQFPFALSAISCITTLSTQILASYFLAYFIIPLFFEKKQYIKAIFYFVLGSYFLCAIARFLTLHILEPLSGTSAKDFETIAKTLTDLFKLIYIYFFRIFSVAFFFLFIKYFKNQTDILNRAALLEKEKTETELKFLKAQLNPHFLFNTLNNIYSLSLSNSSATSESIARLSEILDYILYHCNNLFVSLSGEIKLLENYIALEKLRYDDRLQVHFISEIKSEIEIAPLILLSLVENAFKHGASQDTETPLIEIKLSVNNNIFQFKVRNTIAGQTGEISSDKTIGLRNLRTQLELIYQNKYSLDIQQDSNYYTVTLFITIQREV